MGHLTREFYQNENVLEVAGSLIGKILVTEFEGVTTSGIIVETEAYRGEDDRACHAFPLKKTDRTKTMFLEGGHAYIYLCYGLHHLFNVVTSAEGVPNAILIRALEPISGVDEMLKRRKLSNFSTRISSGPACLSQALGITKAWNAHALSQGKNIWIEEAPIPKEYEIAATTRVGVDYAGEDALLPWRFYISGNKWVSAYPKS